MEKKEEFVKFKDFKTSKDGSAKRIKISSIEEYYVSDGKLIVIHSGRKSVFEYKNKETIKLLISKLDSLFEIINI